MQQTPKAREEQVYTTRRPYLRARGTHKRLDTPAAAEAVEKSSAALVTADEKLAMEDGDSVAGLVGSGGYVPKRSMTISINTVDGPAAKKLTQINAVQVSRATYILKALDLLNILDPRTVTEIGWLSPTSSRGRWGRTMVGAPGAWHRCHPEAGRDPPFRVDCLPLWRLGDCRSVRGMQVSDNAGVGR